MQLMHRMSFLDAGPTWSQISVSSKTDNIEDRWTGEFPAQRASNTENVSIWWHHHGAKSLVLPMFNVENRYHIPSYANIRRKGSTDLPGLFYWSMIFWRCIYGLAHHRLCSHCCIWRVFTKQYVMVEHYVLDAAYSMVRFVICSYIIFCEIRWICIDLVVIHWFSKF